MPKQAMLVSGVLLLLVGAALPVLGYCNRVSDSGLTPFDVAINLSGGQTNVAFAAQRADNYEAFVAVTLPASDSENSTIVCLLGNPRATRNSDCKVRGQLDAEVDIADAAEPRLRLNESDLPIGYEIVGGGSKITATRTLGYFSTIVGHHYVVTASFRSDNPTIRRLKPRLTAFVNNPGIYEGIALSRLIFGALSVLGGLFAIGGISLVTIAYREGRRAASV